MSFLILSRLCFVQFEMFQKLVFSIIFTCEPFVLIQPQIHQIYPKYKYIYKPGRVSDGLKESLVWKQVITLDRHFFFFGNKV